MKDSFLNYSEQTDAFRGVWCKITSNFSWLFAGTAGKLIIGFATTVYLARLLGPHAFGQVAFAQAVLTYFMLLTDCGLQTLGTREIAVGSENRGRIVENIITIRLVLVLVSLTILVVVAPLIVPSPTTGYLLIIFGFSLIPLVLNLSWFFRGLEQMMIVAVSEVVQVAFYLIFLLLIVRNPDQLLLVPVFFLAGHALSSLFLSGAYTRRYGLPKLSISLKDNWHFLRNAVPIAITIFLHQIYYNFDTLMLGYFRGEAEVGLYNAAYRVILAILSLNGVFMRSIYPTLSKLYRLDPSRVKELLEQTLSLSVVFAIPVGIGGTLLAGPLIKGLFGSSFTDAAFAFQILVWSASLAFVGANYGYCLVACGQQKALAFTAGIGTSINLLLNLILIPSLGILGACLATIIAQFLTLICEAGVFALRIFPTFPSAVRTLQASVAGIVMGLGIICVNGALNCLGQISFGIVVYFSILWLIGGIPSHRILSFRRRSHE